MTGRLSVSILGPVEARIDDAPVPVSGARVRMLLTRLALGRGKTVSSGELAEAVWDGSAPADPTNALQTLVSRLRRALGSAGTVLQEPSGYRLALDADDVDVQQFRTLARDGRRHLQDGDAATAARLLGDAEALWRGTALADLINADGEAAALEEERLGAQEDRIDADLRCGRAAEVVAELEKLVADHPLRERPVALVIDALDADARPADALRAYERLRRALGDELGADPSAALQGRHAQLLGATAPAATSAARHRTNLRAQLTSFLGRDAEVGQLTELLEQHRLITLVGPGGAGKTRLVCELGGAVLDDTPDGVWLVELAAVTDPVDLAQAVVGSLGVRNTAQLEARPSARRDAFERLVDALIDRNAILLLDNCEHLIDAVADLADRLLARCPRLRIVATSREPLAITGEALFAVPPLKHDGADPAEILAAPAVRLFADRARAASPGWRLDETAVAAVAAVAEICRRLDGLPLAIELAAARTRTMSVEQIAARLDDRFRLLTGGSRTALPRHRTLRAVVDWSWELLTDAERELAARIAVFPAGVTPQSAAAALGGRSADDLLAALVDRSLLQFVGTSRYRMLETIREYGTDRLAELGLLAEARNRHAEYFLALAREAELQLRQADQLRWIALVDAERDNLYTALTYFADGGDADRAIRLASSLGWFMTMRGEHDVATTWLTIALAVPGGSPGELRTTASGALALNQLIVKDMASGRKALEAVDAELRPMLGPDASPEIAMLGVMVSLFSGDMEFAAERIRIGMQNADPWTRAGMQLMRAIFADNAGDIETMRDAVPKALSVARELGERFLLAAALEGQARLQQLDGDLPAAIESLTECAAVAETFGNRPDAMRSWCTIGTYHLRLGDMEQARHWIEGAAEHFESLDSAFTQIMVDGALSRFARAEGRIEDAVRLADQVLGRAREMSTGQPPQMLALALADWCSTQLARPAPDRDAAAIGATLIEAVETGIVATDMPVLAEVAVVCAVAAWAAGSSADAASTLGVADRLRGAPDPTHPDFVRISAELIGELGEDGFAAAYGAGRSMDRDEALDRLKTLIGFPRE